MISKGGDAVVSLGEVSHLLEGSSGLIVVISSPRENIINPGFFGVPDITYEENPTISVVNEDGQLPSTASGCEDEV